jgi:integrase/recombinase XerD
LLQDISISEAFELYRLEYIVYRNQSPKTEEMNHLVMKSLIAYLGDSLMSELTFDKVRKWKEELTKTKSTNTVRGYIIKLRVVLGHLRLRGYNVLNPDLVGVPKRKTVVVEFITTEEVNSLIDCVFKPQNGYSTLNRYRNRAIVALLYASGIRVSELCSLNRLSIRPDGSFTMIGKGDSARLCFIDDRAALYIKEYLDRRTDNDPSLFISELTGKRISKDTVQAIFRNARIKAGFEKMVHPHTLRHSFATNLLQNNTNLLYVSKFLGHKSVQTTEMYTHVVDEDLRAVYSEKHTL